MYLEAFSTHFSAIEDKRQATKVTYTRYLSKCRRSGTHDLKVVIYPAV